MSQKPDNLTLRSRWVIRRNAILGSARFQRWASRTPFIRGIARRRAAAQFDLIAGFIYSQILSAIVEAGLIEYLRDDLRCIEDVARLAGLSNEAAERLLLAAASLQITESPQAGYWTLGEAGAPLSSNEGAMAMIRHHHLLYSDLAEPLKLMRADRKQETALSAYWTYASKAKDKDGDVAGYSLLMAATQPMVSQQIIDSYEFSAHRKMLDIGGGSGAFCAAVAEACPHLQFGIFDLPDVVGHARKRLDGGNVALHAGDFNENAFPPGYDLITLVRILHDHDDAVVVALLAKIYGALPKDGRLLIVEPMAGSREAKRMGDAYFGIYLWAMSTGRPRTAGTLINMLKAAGFGTVRVVRTDLSIITGALVAIK